jgi:signal peptidase I
MTERIAGISLFSILILLTLLTAARGSLYASRVAVLRALAELLESALLAVALVFLLVRPFLVQSFYIPSGSMHPTLWEGDSILVNKCAYRLHKPERGDILVFRAPREAAPDEKDFIKRLVGLPGDVVAVEAAYVTVGMKTYTGDDIRARVGEPSGLTLTGDAPPLRLTRDQIWLGTHCIGATDFARVVGQPGKRVYIHPGRVLINGQMQMECYVAEDTQYDMAARVVPPNSYFVMGDNRNNSDDSHIWGMLAADRVIGRADYVFWPVSHVKRLQ